MLHDWFLLARENESNQWHVQHLFTTEKNKLGTFVGDLEFCFPLLRCVAGNLYKNEKRSVRLEEQPVQNFKQFSGKEKRVTSAQNKSKLFRGREDSLNQGEAREVGKGRCPSRG